MSIENKELVQKINDAFAKGNFQYLSQYLTEETRWNIIGISTVIGKEEILKALEMQDLENFPDVRVHHVVAEEDSVVVQSTGKAVKKTGRPYRASYCDVYRLTNGKIKEFTTYVIETT